MNYSPLKVLISWKKSNIMQQLQLNLAGFVYKEHEHRSFLLKILDFSFVFTCHFVDKCNKLINKLERMHKVQQ